MKEENHLVTPSPHHQVINGRTQLLGLVGWPVSHSFSPAMHNAAAAALGLNVVYIPLPVHPDDLRTAVPALPALGFGGVNVTVPHKQAVIPLLDELDEAAAAMGAVNTIVVERGLETGDRRLVGFNTDGAGFLADLTELGVVVTGRNCLILGAGGSARAVAHALAQAGATGRILARRPSQAQQIIADLELPFTAHPLADLETVAAQSTAPLIINATPLGMTPNPDASPWPDGLPIPPGAFIYDLVYNPRQTKLMQQARAAGRRAANGLGMLVHQGALAFELWTSVNPDTAVMRSTIDSEKL